MIIYLLKVDKKKTIFLIKFQKWKEISELSSQVKKDDNYRNI